MLVIYSIFSCTIKPIVLHNTIPYCTVLCCAILYYTLLYYTILYYTILYYTILYYTILYYTTLYYAMLYYTILYSSHLRTIPTLPCQTQGGNSPAEVGSEPTSGLQQKDGIAPYDIVKIYSIRCNLIQNGIYHYNMLEVNTVK